jgi:hypothetical protein
MKRIPEPPNSRQYTSWRTWADGTWRLAEKAEGDFTGTAQNWARAGRAWGSRNGWTGIFLIEPDGESVRFCFERDTPEPAQERQGPTVIAAPTPPDMDDGGASLRAAAHDAWVRATEVFFSGAEPGPE